MDVDLDLFLSALAVVQILAGKIGFSRCIATPDMMGVVGRVARVLGPRGLMPNPKVLNLALASHFSHAPPRFVFSWVFNSWCIVVCCVLCGVHVW